MTTVTSIGWPVDIGLVFPPRPGEARGRGNWSGRDLAPDDVQKMLSRAAAANAAGAAIYVRLGPFAREHHPGIVLLDDVDASTVDRLVNDGFQPRLVVETSSKNLQAWIALSVDEVPYNVVLHAIRHLVRVYGADPRAVSPMQPGRLAGYTNRKPKHRQPNGNFPYVRVLSSDSGRVASSGSDLIDHIQRYLQTQPARAARAPETPRSVAPSPTGFNDRHSEVLDRWREEERDRLVKEVKRGSRPSTSASESEVDFAVARRALQESLPEAIIETWIAARRFDKAERYAARTVLAAAQSLERSPSWTGGRR